MLNLNYLFSFPTHTRSHTLQSHSTKTHRIQTYLASLFIYLYKTHQYLSLSVPVVIIFHTHLLHHHQWNGKRKYHHHHHHHREPQPCQSQTHHHSSAYQWDHASSRIEWKLSQVQQRIRLKIKYSWTHCWLNGDLVLVLVHKCSRRTL